MSRYVARKREKCIHPVRQILFVILFMYLVFFGAIEARASACVAVAGVGNWGTAGTWTACASGIPQPGDTVAILTGSTITLNVDTNVVSIQVNGLCGTAAAILQTDSSAHTITLTGAVARGIALSNCGYFLAIQSSAANATTFVAGSVTSAVIGTQFIAPFGCGNITKVDYANVSGIGSGVAFDYDEDNCGSNTDWIKHVVQSGGRNLARLEGFGLLPIVDSNYASGLAGNMVACTNCTSATITDNTDYGATADGALFRASNDDSGLIMTGNAVYSTTNSRAIYSGNNTGTGSGRLFTGNIGKDPIGTSVQGFMGCLGSSGKLCTYTSNVTEGHYTGITFTAYSTLTGNLGIAFAASCAAQGIFNIYSGTNITLTNNVSIISTTDGTCMGAAILANDLVVPVNAAVINHHTGIAPAPTAGSTVNIMIGEGGGTAGVTAASVLNSISQGGDAGIWSNSPNNVFVTSGTGSVGVNNNNSQRGTDNWLLVPGGTNFGVSHPNATYGDSTAAPWIISTTRRLVDCDAILGGAGTLVHMFTTLGLRSSGTNGNFTTTAIRTCMMAPLAPQNTILATQASDGTYIGAMPVNIQNAAAIP